MGYHDENVFGYIITAYIVLIIKLYLYLPLGTQDPWLSLEMF